MNDRFKFRVWDIDKAEYNTDCNFVLGPDGILGEWDSIITYEEDEYIVEQCTGLKDKNGNLIYEGDIVKIGNGSVNGEVIESDLVVEWICKNGRYNLPTWTSDVPDWSHYVEIIGNIHEQPEQKDVK